MNSRLTLDDAEQMRKLLCALGDHIRDAIVHARTTQAASFAEVSRESQADTIYQIDTVSEEAVGFWFEKHWPHQWPVELVMEGLDDNDPVTFPRGTAVGDTQWKCIIDPIDGTRGLMYDKRPAWVLAGIAPQKGADTRLSDLCIAMMTELPLTKQWRADQVSAVRGAGVVAEFVDVFTQERRPLKLQPSRAKDFKHGFSALVKFFPEGKALTAKIEEDLWEALYGLGSTRSPVIFDDQYISTGGQFYELLAGHDRMLGDLRPLVHRAAGIKSSLVCHPYDVCTALILEEAGVIIESPEGGKVDAPLDTVSPVTWLAYANPVLAELARPILRRLIGNLGNP